MSTDSTVSTTESGVTITLNIDEFVKTIRRGTYGHDWDEEPELAIDPILDAAITRLVADLRKEIGKDVRSKAQDAIDAEVAAIVRETLNAEYQPTTEWGSPQGSKTTLRDQVAEAARGWFGQRADGNSYGNASRTKGQKFVADEVDRALREDFKSIVAAEREVLKDRMRQVAAALLSNEATR